MKITFATKVKLLRELYNMSQEEMGEKMGISDKTISKWETEKALPTLENYVTFSEKFNISLDFLLKDKVSNVDDRVLLDAYRKSFTDEKENGPYTDVLKACRNFIEDNDIYGFEDYLPRVIKDEDDNVTGIDMKIFKVDEDGHVSLSKEQLVKYHLSSLLGRFFLDDITLKEATVIGDAILFEMVFTRFLENDSITKSEKKVVLNDTLESLKASNPNYFYLITTLIAHGAYYEKIDIKQEGQRVMWAKIKDVSKTIFVYKIASILATVEDEDEDKPKDIYYSEKHQAADMMVELLKGKSE